MTPDTCPECGTEFTEWGPECTCEEDGSEECRTILDDAYDAAYRRWMINKGDPQ